MTAILVTDATFDQEEPVNVNIGLDGEYQVETP